MSQAGTVMQAQKMVEQLREQAALDRIKVSDSSRDLISYVQQNEAMDPLVNPAENNPFKERNKCILL
ncbi:Guanine nucleotide-binding protein G(I)/G(S)/G(O) subunit gamma-7 [Geodia barretti]|uniref:Guanine nucleotide-binding protein subunit gamma n=2 Tax=Geodia barretti TaxID=519541 RepID=A0AA35T6U4_GEOBA|nr:Guanine nucleotide-binding protein G(I)/G(S)/G(O) subunit gamma-7 [Geodia barretti]